ncbi:TIGR03767 family metallophosphoesterase [Streptomyces misionensis]|uniref:TIGR03767 family metallophosphoesterase n=1 Tax=Streptomyces misionensis TaxID=67331 RepID=UPI0033F4D9EA
MPRTRSVAAFAAGVSRRTVLAAAAAVSLSAGVGYALRPTASEAATTAPAPAPRTPAAGTRGAVPLAPFTKGTTLDSVATPRGASGYRRLGDGPGWPRVVRTELAAAKSGREGRRTTLAAFVQFTDLHVQDVQHPLRLEYMRVTDTHSWRPHEALTVPGAVSLVERVNALRGGPVTGAPLGFVMTTGDNTDNNAHCELEWFMRVMSGGRITPNTGDPRHYEGVQNSGLKMFWQPDSEVRDGDKALGFPHLDGFLAAAVREVRSPGLDVPWYSTVGNHDALPLGCYGSHGDPYLAEAAIGGRKLYDVALADARKLQAAIKNGTDPAAVGYRDFLKAHASGMRAVTADEKRAPYTRSDYLKAHLDPAYQGHGPAGHGYSAANLDAGTQYYAFRISDDVIGISLDTTDPGGHYQGSIGTAQLKWLDRTLRENRDSHAVVFSHHTSASMDNTRPDPDRPGEQRHGGAEVVTLLSRHANVLAWVNGHIHRNVVTPHRTGNGRSFWEISTASHVDHPHLARIIELTDNRDGTISLFTTLIESAAPHRTDFADLSQTGLAALYRELAFNAPGASPHLAGGAADRNTELVLGKG